jgi:hypothetical protein
MIEEGGNTKRAQGTWRRAKGRKGKVQGIGRRAKGRIRKVQGARFKA